MILDQCNKFRFICAGCAIFSFVLFHFAVNGKWQQLKPGGDKLPCLQEHTAVAYKDNIYVFGGEVGFSAGTETPLWMYDVKYNTWRKIRSKKGKNNVI